MLDIKIIKKRKLNKLKLIFACVCGLPTLILYFVFCVFPIFDSVATSFFSWSGFNEKIFVDIQNYVKILKDPIFLKAIGNDFKIVIGKEILIIALTVLFAVSLTRLRFKKKEVSVYRYIYYIPNILSTIIIGIVWSFVFDPKLGILNGLLDVVGLGFLAPKDGWLVMYPLQSITFVASWCGIGLFMIVMIVAINSVPSELYDAAKIDGAGEWKQLWYVTMPAVKRQIAFMVVTILYQTLGGNFGLVLTLVPNGGVDGSAMVMGLYVYNNSIDSLVPRVGFSYAAAIIMLIITATVSMIVNRLVSPKEDI